MVAFSFIAHCPFDLSVGVTRRAMRCEGEKITVRARQEEINDLPLESDRPSSESNLFSAAKAYRTLVGDRRALAQRPNGRLVSAGGGCRNRHKKRPENSCEQGYIGCFLVRSSVRPSNAR